jgi:anhydro-N-acetylmuramic acid kinase
MRELYIGVMSGTSLDGIDVALVALDGSSCELISSFEYEFDSKIKKMIEGYIASNSFSFDEIGELDIRLGLMYAKAINEFIKRFHLNAEEIRAIGLHGQTLWHNPDGEYPFSIQLGSGSVVSCECGIKVACDFRSRDIANGGDGAPLAPAFHRFLLGGDANIAVVNIGGISNISYLGEPTIGYDIGVGNLLMDSWIQKHKSLPYDRDGVWAKSGKVDYKLLDILMSDEYLSRDYPKSTGKERYNLRYIEDALVTLDRELSPEDVHRTLLEFTALSISNDVLKFNPDILLLCGGGANNPLLVERVSTLMPNIAISTMRDSDYIEAMMMGWLAYNRVHSIPTKLSSVTGARVDSVLGALYER